MGLQGFFGNTVLPGIVFRKEAGQLVPVLGADAESSPGDTRRTGTVVVETMAFEGPRGADAQNPDS